MPSWAYQRVSSTPGQSCRLLLEQLVGEPAEWLGHADHLLERVHAEVSLSDMGLFPANLDPQRDRTPVRVPDNTARRLGRDHRERVRVDQPGIAQMARTCRTAGLLVADEVKPNSAVAQQAQLARRGGAVDHAHQAALHVRRAAPDDPAVLPPRPELLGRLRRDDVEVPVEVDRPRPLARTAKHDARFLEPASRRKLDQLGRQTQPRQRLVQGSAATTESPAGWILGVDRDELLQQRSHLVGTRLEPSQDLGDTIGHRLPLPH
jgi:hypothetical protein